MRYESHKTEVLKSLDNAIYKALWYMGIFLIGRIKLLSPVDTGRLKGSYVYVIDSTRRILTVGTNVIYAVFVELGTRFIKAQSHLLPSAMNNTQKLIRLVYKAFEEEFRK